MDRLNPAMAADHQTWKPEFGRLTLVAPMATVDDLWAGLDGSIHRIGASWWTDLHATRPDLRRAYERWTTPHPSLDAAVEAMLGHIGSAYAFLEATFR